MKYVCAMSVLRSVMLVLTLCLVAEEFEIIDDLPSEEDDSSSDSEAEVLDPEEIEKMLDEVKSPTRNTSL